MPTSTGLLTDRYELTMLSAWVTEGTVHHRAVFETFARRLPTGRRYGLLAGLGRLLPMAAPLSPMKDHLWNPILGRPWTATMAHRLSPMRGHPWSPTLDRRRVMTGRTTSQAHSRDESGHCKSRQ